MSKSGALKSKPNSRSKRPQEPQIDWLTETKVGKDNKDNKDGKNERDNKNDKDDKNNRDSRDNRDSKEDKENRESIRKPKEKRVNFVHDSSNLRSWMTGLRPSLYYKEEVEFDQGTSMDTTPDQESHSLHREQDLATHIARVLSVPPLNDGEVYCVDLKSGLVAGSDTFSSAVSNISALTSRSVSVWKAPILVPRNWTSIKDDNEASILREGGPASNVRHVSFRNTDSDGIISSFKVLIEKKIKTESKEVPLEFKIVIEFNNCNPFGIRDFFVKREISLANNVYSPSKYTTQNNESAMRLWKFLTCTFSIEEEWETRINKIFGV